MRRAWGLAAACLVLALPTAVAPASGMASPTYLAGLTLVVAGLWAGALIDRGAARRGWVLIAVTASLWLGGDILQRTLQARGFTGVGIPDVFWLASYGTLAAGVWLMIRARGLRRTETREIRLDVAVVTAASVLPAWRLMVAPSLADGGGALDRAVAVLYPVGDLVLFALAVMLVVAPGTASAAGRLILACLSLTLVTDVLFAALPDLAPAFDASRLDAVLLCANGLLAAASLHPSRDALSVRAPGHGARHMHRSRILLLGVGVTATTVGAALAPHLGTVDRVLGAAAGLVAALAITLRFASVVRERESAEERLIHQAHHDPLTGLANRSLLLERLGGMLFGGHAERGIAVLYIDLDGFKEVNDRWGHAAGDAVLLAAGRRLAESVRADDLVARVGGDEFVILCPATGAEDAEGLARRLHRRLGDPVDAGGRAVAVAASIGVFATTSVRVGAETLDADALLRAADSAMYRAKRGGGGVRIAAMAG
ncbi:MAG: GGDEF domain-containing protein [Thermoleophilia bacterium]